MQTHCSAACSVRAVKSHLLSVGDCNSLTVNYDEIYTGVCGAFSHTVCSCQKNETVQKQLIKWDLTFVNSKDIITLRTVV